MRQVLVNPLSGYYMLGDVFGQKGDFITSPEISQVFGELCGLWYLTEWMRLGQPEKIQIIEFGPGRGTLMSDMLRTLSQFPQFYKTLTDVHLVEASPGLRKMQRAALVKGSEEKDVVRIEGSQFEAPVESISRQDGIKVSWHDGIEVVPDQWSFVMAHEFFDALPIHSFEKTESEWRELMVDIDDTEESYSVMDKITKFLDRNGGSGLAIDYGQDYIQGDTLRAIKNHKIIHPMSDPGTADLSADVDFSFLKKAISQGSDVTAYGPVTQKDFLVSLGIQARVEQLFRSQKTSAGKKALLDGAERLVSPEAMGRIYKVLAFAKDNNASVQSEPVGFEGKNEATAVNDTDKH
ncbi:S-adenosyl-L-methionine-dependent methyltransferase [Gilbertella persicaria]|uniref:S-adenosyl-L-methionine-dependent methyltransferase n=1 Tax=Gilbertella persicaria TaxID=101096 RepID=UPI00222098B5|nr:S-adenosyl-L-methionine-dependent methyltransferase [Gilbertella persicaria]KAI8061890.1 S-adenosyl-L-methionine-dependent methyltransferase [Gilbertella persicaria]